MGESVQGTKRRVGVVKGEVDQVVAALHLVAARVAELEDKHQEASEGSANLSKLHIVLPNSQVGAVIGKGGATISGLRQLGAYVKISEEFLEDSDEKAVFIRGTSEQMMEVLKTLCDSLAEVRGKIATRPYNPRISVMSMPPSPYQNQAYPAMAPTMPLYGQFQGAYRELPIVQKVVIPVPSSVCGAIIGARGGNVRDIRGRSGATISIEETDQKETRTVTISGNRRQCDIAVGMVYDKIAQAEHEPSPPRKQRASNAANAANAANANAGAEE